MKFKKIASGIDTKTKTGKEAIKLTFDIEAKNKIADKDFETGMWIFKNKNTQGHTYYSVMCSMPDDYEINYKNMAKNWSKKFEDKHQTETNKDFQKWEEK